MAQLRCDLDAETYAGATATQPSAPLGRSSLSMTNDTPVASETVTIQNALGLHFRPADKFVRLAMGFRSDVKVRCKGGEYSGKSMLDLTGLGAEKGTDLVLEARGSDAADAVAALAKLVRERFHEDDEGQEQDPAP